MEFNRLESIAAKLSFDVWYTLFNVYVVGLGGAALFVDAEHALIWILSFALPFPLSLFMDTHPFKRKFVVVHYFSIVIAFAALLCAIFFQQFEMQDRKLYVLNGDISIMNRTYSALFSLFVFVARWVRSSALRSTKDHYVLYPSLQSIKLDPGIFSIIKTTVTITRRELQQDRGPNMRQKKKSRKYNAASVLPQAANRHIATSSFKLDRSITAHESVLSENILLKCSTACTAVLDQLFAELDHRKTLPHALIILHEFITVISNQSESEPGMVAVPVQAGTSGSSSSSSSSFSSSSKAKKVRCLVPTFRPFVIRQEESIAARLGGTKLQAMNRFICRQWLFKLTTLISSFGAMFGASTSVLTGNLSSGAIGALFSAIATICQIIQMGLGSARIFQLCLHRFTSLYFLLILASIAVNGMLCANNHGTRLMIGMLSLLVSTYVFSDALPLRKLTRIAILCSIGLLLLLMILLSVALWQDFTPAFIDYNISIIGRNLNCRQSLLSSCLVIALYTTRFLYRGIFSKSRLLLVDALMFERLPMADIVMLQAAADMMSLQVETSSTLISRASRSVLSFL